MFIHIVFGGAATKTKAARERGCDKDRRFYSLQSMFLPDAPTPQRLQASQHIPVTGEPLCALSPRSIKCLSGIVVLLAGISLACCANPCTRPSATSAPNQAPPQTSAGPPFFTETGLASFYGGTQDGNRTANGDTFNRRSFTAAHHTLAFGTVVRVTNTGNGQSVKVQINDRGPHVKGRIIDLSAAAARALAMQKEGVAPVRLEAFQEDQAPD